MSLLSVSSVLGGSLTEPVPPPRTIEKSAAKSIDALPIGDDQLETCFQCDALTSRSVSSFFAIIIRYYHRSRTHSPIVTRRFLDPRISTGAKRQVAQLIEVSPLADPGDLPDASVLAASATQVNRAGGLSSDAGVDGSLA